MKLKFLLAHTLSAFVGAGIVFFIFTENVIPSISEGLPTDSFFIELPSEADKLIPHWEILGQKFLGKQYLSRPYYPHKRDEGYQILESLALRGYTPAANSLYSYHLNQMDLNKDHKELYKEHLDKAYKWAKLAAQQGMYVDIGFLIYMRDLGKYRDITEDLESLENWVNTKASSPTSMEYLSKYYAEHGNKEKAEHFANLAHEVRATPRPHPECTIVTPWKGW